MNLSLLDPHIRNALPEHIEQVLDDGLARCSAFNRRGNLLAIGCNDGRCVLWDFDTRGIAKVFIGHVHPITAVSWSRDGKSLLTASTDWNLILWDILTSNTIIRIRFDSPILHAELCQAKGTNLCVVCPFRDPPMLVDLTTGIKTILPRDPKRHPNVDPESLKATVVPSLPGSTFLNDLAKKPALSASIDTESKSDADKSNMDVDTEAKAAPTATAPAPTPGSVAKYQKTHISTAAFTRKGEKIFIGDPDGYITIIDTKTLEIDSCVPICPGSPIKSIVWALDETQYLVNSTDKSIRLVSAADNSVVFEIFDAVNKIQWKKCCFSGDGDYIIAGSAQKHEHKIYIWSRHFKNHLFKLLEGPKEGILDLIWHPLRSMAISCSTTGAVYIWNARYHESWSAFAPGFTELEENEEYIEREEEFDVLDAEAEAKRKKQTEEEQEDVEIDVVTIAKQDYLSDDDEELFFLPSVPIPDWHMPAEFLVPEQAGLKPSLAPGAVPGAVPDLPDDPLKVDRRKTKAKRKAPTPGPSDEKDVVKL